ncbi:radical SAM protein [candidate division KSB1 bacterium]|nr:radical SAM protein [candidate division KSB1 bacterium]
MSREFEAASGWIANNLMSRPWAISIEITHNCNANCLHCDKGEHIKDEKRASIEEYLRIYKEAKPIVVQISGGEPMMRKDYLDIVKAFHNPGHMPYLVFVTNAGLLTEEKYDELKAAGVDKFSISIDFPDERHDENRKVKGLFKHLDELIPKIMAKGNNDVTMITAVTRKNYPYLMDNLRIVEGWGAALNFSMYTSGRTGDEDLLIRSAEDLKKFRAVMDQLIEAKRQGSLIFSSEEILNRYYAFFENGAKTGNCKVGKRSFVVNPDGSICPCAMKKDLAYKTHKEIKQIFVRHNTCDQCFISLRANTEKPIWELVRDIWSTRASL